MRNSSWTLMRRAFIVALVMVGAGFGTAVPASGDPPGLPARYQLADLKVLEDSFVELAKDVRPSVVAIRTYFVPDPDEVNGRRVRIPVSQGSGFVLSADGYIGTNQHVLDESNTISVILDNGLQYEGRVVQGDSRSDLAVLKIDAEGLTPVRLGDLDEVKIGQWTFAVGNPFGLANENGRMSVSFGTVSQLGRDMTRRLVGDSQSRYYGNLIESCSAINPGNSGGPLFNIDGEMIGVIVAIETSSGVSEGVGFAIPIDDDIRHVLHTLKNGEKMRYGYLGVEIRSTEAKVISPDVSPEHVYAGAEITGVVPDGPADAAGLRIGDVVTEVDGDPVENADHLVRMVSFSPVGTEVRVTYLRRNVKRTVQVTLGDRNALLASATKR
ncbi:MAG: trypsin-like peptidase domain-containing protein [Phycisphaerae bacterium]|nr:trypsin-like peptidase domain-containing protein [Phycisphaerae bacterium]